MAIRTLLLRALCCAALLVLGASDAIAHHTYFTFSHSVEVPGEVTLPPGRYEFRIIQSTADRRITEVRDANTDKVHATILSIPAEHSGWSAKSQVRFMEVSDNRSPAVLFWWQGNGRVGHELVYTKEQAMRRARCADQRCDDDVPDVNRPRPQIRQGDAHGGDQ